jgi:FkbM family methyltransferase
MRWILGSTEPNYWLRPYEQAKISRLLTYLRPDAIFYDIGANAGYYSLIAAHHVRHVYAFEPLPINVRYLRRHIAINRLLNCTTVEAAVTDRDGMTSFHLGRTRCEGAVGDGGDLLVHAVRLDSYQVQPDVIKIDVEGGELGVLEGARRVLAHHPVIFVATHTADLYHQCRRLLMECGYRVEDLEAGELLAT